MRNHFWGMFILVSVLGGCLPQLQSYVVSETETPIATATAVPSPTPAGPEVVVTHPELEVISPENINRLEQVASWGEGRVYDYAISPDQSIIAVSLLRGIYLYDARTLGVLKFIQRVEIPLLPEYLAVVFSQDGKYLLYPMGTSLILYDLENSKVADSIHNSADLEIRNFAMGQDKKSIILISTLVKEINAVKNGDLELSLYVKDQGRWKRIYSNICTDSWMFHFRFTEKKVYFFYIPNDGTNQWTMDWIDLASHEMVRDDGSDSRNFNHHYYDISPDGKILADFDIVKGSMTNLLDAKTKKLLTTVPDSVKWDEYYSSNSVQSALKEEDEEIRKCLNLTESGYIEVLARNDGRVVISQGKNSTTRLELWNLDGCGRERTIAFQSKDSLEFAPNGTLVNLEPDGVDIWDVAAQSVRFTPETVAPPIEGVIRWSLFSRDGRTFLVESYKTIWHDSSESPTYLYTLQKIDTQTGKVISTVDLKEISHFAEEFSPNFNYILSSDGYVRDFNTGIRVLTLPDGVLHFNQDETGVWLVSEHYVSYFNLQTRKQSQYFDPPGSSIVECEFSPDDQIVACLVCMKDGPKEIVYMSLATGDILFEKTVTEDIQELSAAGRYFYTLDMYGSMDLYTYSDPFHLKHLAYFPDEANLENAAIGHNILQTDRSNFYNEFLPFVVAPNGDYLIEKQSTTQIRFRDVQTGWVIAKFTLNYSIPDSYWPTISISPDGRLIAVAGDDGIIRLWGVKAESAVGNE
jgi:WD40 repeat protein